MGPYSGPASDLVLLDDMSDGLVSKEAIVSRAICSAGLPHPAGEPTRRRVPGSVRDGGEDAGAHRIDPRYRARSQMTASGCSAKCFGRPADPWVLRRGRAGRPASPRTGLLVEFDRTDTLFTQPADKRTEDYITGRFG